MATDEGDQFLIPFNVCRNHGDNSSDNFCHATAAYDHRPLPTAVLSK